MQRDGRASDSRTATLEAFYARVMQRVCAAYREESELPADEAVKLLEKKWKDKLALYTGNHEQSVVAAQTDGVSAVGSVASASDSDIVESSDEEDAFLSSSSSSSSSEAASGQAVGRPSAQLPGAAHTTKSVFARMLGAKRKLHQLDGAESDTEDDMEWLDMAEQEPLILQTGDAEIIDASPAQNAGDDDEGTQADAEGSGEGEERGIHDDEEEEKEAEDRPSSPADSTASTSFLVSASDLAPVSGLSGINLPLQLAAEYSSFNHRGKRRGYVGQLHAIVLTWPSRLGAREPIRPGELVWCCPDSEQALLHEGELVKVRSLGDSLKDVRVELSNGWEATVRLDRVRRLKEYLIRKGSVRLRSEQ